MTNPSIPPCPVCGTVPEVDAQFDDECKPRCGHIRSPVATIMIDDWTHSCNYELGRGCRELGIETVEQLKTRLAPDPRVAVLEDGIRVALQMCGYKKVGEIESANRYETLDALGLLTQLIAAQRGEGV